MAYKGRTVFLIVLLAMLASSMLTVTIINPSLLADKKEQTGDPKPKRQVLSEKELGKLTGVVDILEKYYLLPVDRQELLEGAIQGMLSTLGDPHSSYISRNDSSDFMESVMSYFSGIGAEVTMKDGRLTVVSPIKGSPAERAGIHTNDVILSVNGEKLEGLTLNESVAKIRGPKGTQAKLEILRPGAAAPIQIIVVRDDIDVETVYAELREDKIGVISITQFGQHTSTRFIEELALLEAEGMQGLIIDVRYNPGGIYHTAIELLDHLLPEGAIILQTEDRLGGKEATVATGTGKEYPMAVLINEGSASASEILAAALQQNVGSRLIGTTTHGKGSVQMTFSRELGDGSNIKLTVAKWLTPNGDWIDQIGVEPDVLVEQPAFFRTAPLSKKETLKYDMNNADVRNLQVMLDVIGFNPDRTDGYFSANTREQVKAFQTGSGLAATGEVDEETAAAIEEAFKTEAWKPEYDWQLNKAVEHIQQLLAG